MERRMEEDYTTEGYTLEGCTLEACRLVERSMVVGNHIATLECAVRSESMQPNPPLEWLGSCCLLDRKRKSIELDIGQLRTRLPFWFLCSNALRP